MGPSSSHNLGGESQLTRCDCFPPRSHRLYEPGAGFLAVDRESLPLRLQGTGSINSNKDSTGIQCATMELFNNQ